MTADMISARLRDESAPAILLSGEEHTDWPSLVADVEKAFWQEKDSNARYDTIRINEEGKPIKIRHIEELRRELTWTPMSGRRLVVIHAAEKLLHASASALLKTLEEPSSGTRFLLTTGYRRRLLPTILSRCEVIRIPPVPGSSRLPSQKTDISDILAAVKSAPLSDDDLERIHAAIQSSLQEHSAPDVFRCLLRLRDYYKIRESGGNTKLAADVLKATLQSSSRIANQPLKTVR